MVVDSSVWMEILSHGPLHQRCEEAIFRQSVKVPSLVLFEIYRKLKARISEDAALETVTALSRYEILDLTREIALLAGDISLEHKLSMADSMVLAHAEFLGETLLTLDNDFASLPNVRVIRKS